MEINNKNDKNDKNNKNDKNDKNDKQKKTTKTTKDKKTKKEDKRQKSSNKIMHWFCKMVVSCFYILIVTSFGKCIISIQIL